MALKTVLTQPAIIWALDFEDGRPLACAEDGPIPCAPERGNFRWLHLNLSDHWTRDWIERADAVPRPLRAMLLSAERHQRAVVENGWIGCVLHDMERDFDREDVERTGVLRLVLGPQPTARAARCWRPAWRCSPRSASTPC